MKNKALYIGLGVAALAVVGFLAFGKKQGSADDMATKSADVDSEMDEMDEKQASKPAKGTALSSLAKPAKATAPSKEVSTPKVPTATTTPIAAATAPSTASKDILFLAYGISQADYDKMEAEQAKRSAEIKAANLPKFKRFKVMIRLMGEFARNNNINYEAYRNARKAKLSRQAAAASAANVATASTPQEEAGDGFAFSFADDTYDIFV
jgi:hypothetical protein